MLGRRDFTRTARGLRRVVGAAGREREAQQAGQRCLAEARRCDWGRCGGLKLCFVWHGCPSLAQFRGPFEARKPSPDAELHATREPCLGAFRQLGSLPFRHGSFEQCQGVVERVLL